MVGRRSCLSSLLALLIAAAASSAAGPTLPSFAKDPAAASWKDYQYIQLAINQKTMRNLNARNKQQDFVLYGCSVDMMFVKMAKQKGGWNDYFKSSEGWAALPMAISGNDVRDVVWRIMAGGERPKVDPKVVGFLMAGRDDWDRQEEMSWLLKYLQKSMPHTKLLLMAMLPTAATDIRPINRKYQALAAELGVHWVSCGQSINPRSRSMMLDGTHPTLKAQKIVLDCLYPAVERLVRG